MATGICCVCQSEKAVRWDGDRWVMAPHHAAGVMGPECDGWCVHYKCRGAGTVPQVIVRR